MSKSKVIHEILTNRSSETITRSLLSDNLDKLFAFTASAEKAYAGGKDFATSVADALSTINSEKKLTGSDYIFGIFLDYLAMQRNVIDVSGTRAARNYLLKAKPITRSEDKLFWYNTFSNDNTLAGNELTWDDAAKVYNVGAKLHAGMKSFFMGDLIWLYYHEEMGIFKILGKLMDDVYRTGSFPIPFNSLAGTSLHANVQLFRNGLASNLSDRESAYRRCLGWNCEDGIRLDLKSVMNENFKTAFHQFISTALEYYNEKRVIASIQSISPAGTQASINTIMSVRDTIETLRQSFDPFKNGENIFYTGQGILNVISGFFTIYHSREFIGVPRNNFESPEDFIPEAIRRLNIQVSAANNNNRYIIYRNAAEYGRDLLLDIEAFANYQDTNDLKIWLDAIEEKVESYRTAYRHIKGIDLAPKIQKSLAA